MKKTPHTGVVPERPRKRGRSSVVPPKKKPKQISCLQCNSAPAIELAMTNELFTCIAFCCEKCALEFALCEFRLSYFSWCKRHEVWTARDGKCPTCKASRKEKYATAGVVVDQDLFCELEMEECK